MHIDALLFFFNGLISELQQWFILAREISISYTSRSDPEVIHWGKSKSNDLQLLLYVVSHFNWKTTVVSWMLMKKRTVAFFCFLFLSIFHLKNVKYHTGLFWWWWNLGQWKSKLKGKSWPWLIKTVCCALQCVYRVCVCVCIECVCVQYTVWFNVCIHYKSGKETSTVPHPCLQ